MKKNKKHILLALAFSISLGSFGAENKILEETKYKITYPDDWQLDQSGIMGTSFILFSPRTDSTDLFRDNVNLMVQDLKGAEREISIQEFLEVSVAQINMMITNVSKIDTEIKDGKAKLEYTGTQGKVNIHYNQLCVIEQNVAYILTFTSAIESYERWKKIGHEMLNSFQFNH